MIALAILLIGLPTATTARFALLAIKKKCRTNFESAR